MLPIIIKALNTFNLGFFQEVERSGKVAILASSLFPNYFLKVPIQKNSMIFTTYRAKGRTHPVEENSFQLRVPTSLKMREIVEDYSLNLLYVPQKWDLDQRILVEKLNLLSWEETVNVIKDMPDADQREYIQQIFILLRETGNQDIPRNLRFLRDQKTLALPDTEPHGTTLEKIEDLRPWAYLAFINEPLFNKELKLQALQDVTKL